MHQGGQSQTPDKLLCILRLIGGASPWKFPSLLCNEMAECSKGKRAFELHWGMPVAMDCR